MGLNIQRNVKGVPELDYCPDYLDAQQQAELLTRVDAQPWLGDMGRRVQHYGHRYDYKSRTAKRLGPLPSWLERLSKRLVQDGLSSRRFDQVIVNEYLPGQGIGRHTDAPSFGDTIISISLGDAWEMDFSGPGAGPRGRAVLLEEGSAVIMRGPARSVWKHGIAPRTQGRSRRVSLTFRWVDA